MKKLVSYFSKLFHVDASYILKGGFWLGIDQAVSVLASVVLTIAFANLLPKEIYGTYRYIISLFGIMSIATLPNMNIAVTSSVSKGYEGSIDTILATRIRWGTMGSLASVLIAIYYMSVGSAEIAIGLCIVALFLPFSDSLTISGAFLKGKKLFREQAGFTVLTRTVSASALLVALFFTNNLFIILLAYFVPYLIMRGSVYIYVRRRFISNTNEDAGVITYGKHLSAIQVMNTVINYLDNILIFHLLGPISLAGYTIALAPVNKLLQVVSIMPDLALPKFANRSYAEVRQSLIRKILRVEIIMVVGVMLYIFFAPFLFRTFLPQYIDSIFYSQLLSVVLLAAPFGLIYTLFQAHALKKKLYQYNISIRVVQTILTILLVSFYGIIGAVIGRILFQIWSTTILLFLLKKAPK